MKGEEAFELFLTYLMKQLILKYTDEKLKQKHGDKEGEFCMQELDAWLTITIHNGRFKIEVSRAPICVALKEDSAAFLDPSLQMMLLTEAEMVETQMKALVPRWPSGESSLELIL